MTMSTFSLRDLLYSDIKDNIKYLEVQLKERNSWWYDQPSFSNRRQVAEAEIARLRNETKRQWVMFDALELGLAGIREAFVREEIDVNEMERLIEGLLYAEEYARLLVGGFGETIGETRAAER